MSASTLTNSLLALVLCLATMLAASPVRAQTAELVMMEETGCVWCARWNKDIGVFYHKTDEGRVAPLRRVNVHEPMPADLSFLRSAYFTPTFILVSDRQEVGRIEGYPGEDFFWTLLQELIAKIPSRGAVKADASQ